MFESDDDKQEFMAFLDDDLQTVEGIIRPCFFGRFRGQVCKGDLGDAKNGAVMAEALMQMVNKNVIEHGFAVVAEASMTKMKKDSKLDVATIAAMPPELRPFTVDVVMVTFVGLKGEEVWYKEIGKDRDFSKEWNKVDYSGIEGTFKNFYKRAKAKYN